VRCVECDWVQLRGGPWCGFIDQQIPPHISTGHHNRAGPAARERVAVKLTDGRRIEGAGMCTWALFEFAGMTNEERQGI
jgi:hypothetical protein